MSTHFTRKLTCKGLNSYLDRGGGFKALATQAESWIFESQSRQT